MPRPKPLYEAGSLHIEAYDSIYHPTPPALDGDIAFYLDLARNRQPVLDLCCGTGRVALPLAAAGIEVTGLDLSPGMLAIAADKRDRLPKAAAERLDLRAGDLAAFALERSFALIIVAFRSFQMLLTVEAQRAALACIRRHLRPDSLAVLHLFDPRLEFLLPDSPQLDEHSTGVSARTGNLVETTITVVRNDPVRQIKAMVWRHRELSPKGQSLREEASELQLRWTYRWEMRHLVELCGFTVEAEYSDFKGTPPTYGGEQIWLLAPSES